MRIPSFEPVKFRDRWILDVPASCSETGKRRRLYFESLEDARLEAKTYRDKIKIHGRSAFQLSPPQADDAVQAYSLLEQCGLQEISLTAIVKDYASRHQSDKTLRQVWEQFMSLKSRSKRYVLSMNRTYAMLEHLHEKPIAAITTDELEDVLIKYSPSHQATKTREIRAVFRWAKRRGFCQDNPADRLTFTEVRPKLGEREVIEPGDLRKLLNTCLTPAPCKNPTDRQPEHFEKFLIAPLAILFFAGVRPAEMERLQWRDIDLDEGMIDLPAKITKRGRRSIPIEPALKAWLEKHMALCGPQHGRVCKWGAVQLRRNREKLCRRAGIPWQQNWARHSYAGYWLAQHGDLNKLALHMGHTGGLEVLHRHYYRCVRQAEAEAYWDIFPEE